MMMTSQLLSLTEGHLHFSVMPPTLRPLLRNLPTIAPVPHRSLLYLSGSQASEFLNGVLASSVPNPAKGPFFSTFLHAQVRKQMSVT